VRMRNQQNPASTDVNKIVAEVNSTVQEYGSRLGSLLTDLNHAVANLKPPAFEAGSRSPVPDSCPEAWIPKREAIQFLGLSERHVARRVAKGIIRKKTLPRQPHESAPKVLYAREDVEAYARRVAAIYGR
jgi:hypothetical protein